MNSMHLETRCTWRPEKMEAGGPDTPGGPYMNICMNCRLNLDSARREKSGKPGHLGRPT